MALYDLNTAKQKVNDYSANKYSGRRLSDQQFNQLGEAVNYQGGNIDDNLLNRAYGEVDKFATAEGWNTNTDPGGVAIQLPPSGGNPIDPGGSAIPMNPGGNIDPGGTAIPMNPGNGSVPPSQGGGATPPDLAAIIGPGGQLNAAQQAAQEAVLSLLTNAQRAATISDPNLQPVADAYRSRRQRGFERERNALAEMAAANGTAGSGGFESEVLGAMQGANRDTAMFEGELVRGELDKRRQELQQGIALAAQMGDAQAQDSLQRQLALLNASLQQQDLDLRRSLGLSDLDLRRSGLDLNRELGRGDLDLRNRTLSQQGALGRGDLALRLMQSLLQNDQFYSGLGLNAAQLQAMLNQNAITSLLGGM